MPTVFPPRAPVTAPVTGRVERFPVGRIYCVGRNYAAHAREMGSDPAREEPFFFTKDADACVAGDGMIAYPPATRNFHYETELVVAIGASGFEVAANDASALIFGYAVGLDMTRRDLQEAAKASGRPWSTGKNFPQSAPLSAIRPVEETGLLTHGALTLKVNGAMRQSADVADMIWSVNEILAHLSNLYRLQAGDLVFTGTPAGVGAVQTGDVLEAAIEHVGFLRIAIGESQA